MIICLVWIDKKRLVYAVTAGITTILLSAWWVGPFLFGHEFMTDMTVQVEYDNGTTPVESSSWSEVKRLFD